MSGSDGGMWAPQVTCVLPPSSGIFCVSMWLSFHVHTHLCVLGVERVELDQDSFLFLITEVLQSSKRSSLVETNKNRSGALAKAPTPWRAQVERRSEPQAKAARLHSFSKTPCKEGHSPPPLAPQVAAPLINGRKVE